MQFSDYDKKIFSAFCLVAKESNQINQVTIAKIATKIGVTRQSIYKSYYGNINEIIDALHIYIDSDIHATFEEGLSNVKTPSDCIRFISDIIIPKLYQHRDYLHILYGTTIDTTWHVFLTKKYRNEIEKLLKINNDFSSENIEYIVAATLAIIGVWMRCEKPEHPLYFGKRFIFLMENSISTILNGD